MVNKNGRNRCRLTGSLWAVILLGAGLVFVFDLFNVQSPQIILQRNAPKGAEKFEANERYIVNTRGCRIQHFAAMSDEVSPYVFKPEATVCNNGTPPLVDSNASAIFVLDASLSHYGAEDMEDVNCCYTAFWSNFGSKITYNKTCVPFRESAEITDEFIKVSCKVDNRMNDSASGSAPFLYEDYFSFAIQKAAPKRHAASEKGDRMNVLVFGIDGMSRINFHRQLPATVSFLKNNLSAVEMMGYNKVDDNTFPNLIPVLSGLTTKELKAVCWPNYQTVFDKCPFIWSAYRNSGYLTAFGEDAAWMGLFHYQKRGFNRHPTDYYWRTFSEEAETQLGTQKQLNCVTCIGPRPTHTKLWSYVTKFARTLHRNAYFGFFWETALSHDFLNSPAMADELYYTSLVDLQAAGFLNNTVLIFMSDHGIRWGGIRYTNQGSYEDRLPGLFVSLPEAYRIRYPHVYRNLLRNAQVLTTPFDVHETLRDLIEPFDLTRERVERRSENGSRSRFSLLEKIPEERNCEDAKIPIHWCTCQNSIEIDRDDREVFLALNFLLKHINKELLVEVNCATLCLDRVYKATVQVTFSDDKVIDHSQVYKIIFSTKPGLGIFEATVKKYVLPDKNFWYKLEGGLSRLNVYGNQSYCVVDIYLKLFCYCL